MNAWPNTLRTETIGKLRDEFQIWKETTIADEPEIHHEETTAPSFMKKIFSSSSQEVNDKSEIDNYLNENESKPLLTVFPEYEILIKKSSPLFNFSFRVIIT